MLTLEQRRITVRDRYAAGKTMREVAEELGVGVATVRRDLQALGIRARQGRVKAATKAATVAVRRRRVEELYAGEKRSIRDVAEEVGVSSDTVLKDLRALRIATRAPGAPRRHGSDETRACDHCEKDFLARAWEIARGRRFCSRSCANAANARPRRAGRVVECAHCGAEHWHWASWLRSGSAGRFCSRRCWWSYRSSQGLLPIRFVESCGRSGRGKWGANARRRWLGRLHGRRSGRGRPRGYSDADARAVLELHRQNPRLGERVLADRIGVSRGQVKSILGRPRR